MSIAKKPLQVIREREVRETPSSCQVPRYNSSSQRDLIRQLKIQIRHKSRVNPHTESAKQYFEHLGEEADVEEVEPDDDDNQEPEQSGLNEEEYQEGLEAITSPEDVPADDIGVVSDYELDMTEINDDTAVIEPELEEPVAPAESPSAEFNVASLEQLDTRGRLEKIKQIYLKLKLRPPPTDYYVRSPKE